ncbi:MAG: hypothetical protein HZA54_16725 [Planctomycetes bacterium]|nr:hypothetical protein [Planctomycetota bacterium]
MFVFRARLPALALLLALTWLSLAARPALVAAQDGEGEIEDSLWDLDIAPGAIEIGFPGSDERWSWGVFAAPRTRQADDLLKPRPPFALNRGYHPPLFPPEVASSWPGDAISPAGEDEYAREAALASWLARYRPPDLTAPAILLAAAPPALVTPADPPAAADAALRLGRDPNVAPVDPALELAALVASARAARAGLNPSALAPAGEGDDDDDPARRPASLSSGRATAAAASGESPYDADSPSYFLPPPSDPITWVRFEVSQPDPLDPRNYRSRRRPTDR